MLRFSVKGKRYGHRFPGQKRNIFSENRGGVRGRLEVFRKFIEYGRDSHPLVRMLTEAIAKEVRATLDNV